MIDPEKSKTPIGRFGKFGLISHITGGAKNLNKSTVSVIGDDSAIIDPGDNLMLVSTDLLLEGIHFNLIYTPLKHLGYKAVIRAISDIYAMNGSPGQVLIALGLSSRYTVEQVDALYEGVELACRRYSVDLAGGDTTSSLTGLIICVTATGLAGRNSIVKRDGAKPNDLICVTGNLGAAFMGLRVLERERRLFDKDKNFKPELTGYKYIIERQLKPEFPTHVITGLNDRGIVPTSMIDVSEGLASDLFHICKLSGTGCRIYYERIPIDPETARAAGEFGIDPVTSALNGGEDNELLFTIPLEYHEKIRDISGVKVIGHITVADQGCFLVNETGTEIELKAQGWERAE